MRNFLGIDYCTFGSPMPGRQYSSSSYRYGFNGQENDQELGSGVTTADYWEYDGKLGRRWNTDPVVKSWESPYATFNDSPINISDHNGDTGEDKDAPKDDQYDPVPNTKGAEIRTNFDGATKNFVYVSMVPTDLVTVEGNIKRQYYFTPEPTATQPDVGYYSYVESTLTNPDDAPDKPTNKISDKWIATTSTVTIEDAYVAFTAHGEGAAFNDPGLDAMNLVSTNTGRIGELLKADIDDGPATTYTNFTLNVEFHESAPASYQAAAIRTLGGSYDIGTVTSSPSPSFIGPPIIKAGGIVPFTTVVTYTVVENKLGVWVEH